MRFDTFYPICQMSLALCGSLCTVQGQCSPFEGKCCWKDDETGVPRRVVRETHDIIVIQTTVPKFGDIFGTECSCYVFDESGDFRTVLPDDDTLQDMFKSLAGKALQGKARAYFYIRDQNHMSKAIGIPTKLGSRVVGGMVVTQVCHGLIQFPVLPSPVSSESSAEGAANND